jgi:thioredoxin 1
MPCADIFISNKPPVLNLLNSSKNREMKKMLFLVALPVMAVPLLFDFVPYFKNSCRQTAGFDTEKGIHFESKGWNHAMEEAKRQKKLIFLDAYTSWCGPCKLLKKNTFTDKAVGEFFNKNFINVTEDMEKGVGIQLADTYKVNAYPTLLITDSVGNVVTYTKGYLSPEQLIEFGNYALKRKTF